MTFAPGLRGHPVPKAVVLVPCGGAARVCATPKEKQSVRPAWRLREADRRRSCATNSPVQVRPCCLLSHILDVSKAPKRLPLESPPADTSCRFSPTLIGCFTNCYQTGTCRSTDAFMRTQDAVECVSYNSHVTPVTTTQHSHTSINSSGTKVFKFQHFFRLLLIDFCCAADF